MKEKPYIGITGATNIYQAKNICEELDRINPKKTIQIPMLGFLVMDKILEGKKIINKRYPEIKELPDLLKISKDKCFNMIHYFLQDHNKISDQIKRLYEFENIYEANLCRALQLNIDWPDVKYISKIKEDFSEMKIVLIASKDIMKKQSATEISKRFKEYESLINYILIDPSGGKSIPFDIKSSVDLYLNLKNDCPKLGIGFAGGFNCDNIEKRLEILIKEIGNKDFSIDIEGGIRDKFTKRFGDDLLNIEKAKEYLNKAYLKFV